MDNSAELRAGLAKAKKIISRHVVGEILIPMADALRKDAESTRISLGHNMTGNTVNSYVAAVFDHGTLVWESTSGTTAPLRNKLRAGQKFYAGDHRWDGERQQNTFKAQTYTDGRTEPAAALDFIKSYSANPRGFVILICNGVEYATWQESQMNIDVLTGSFNAAQMLHKTYFKPLTE